ncbi:hypothetical protein J6590_101698 [Homalodisca vitripennis]|nr:hypothetical protein J6590_101698 [Homalodisca vitripennis]
MGTADVREAPRMRSECRARRMRSHRTRQVESSPFFAGDMTEYPRDTSPWNLDRRQHLPTTFPV